MVYFFANFFLLLGFHPDLFNVDGKKSGYTVDSDSLWNRRRRLFVCDVLEGPMEEPYNGFDGRNV